MGGSLLLLTFYKLIYWFESFRFLKLVIIFIYLSCMNLKSSQKAWLQPKPLWRRTLTALFQVPPSIWQLPLPGKRRLLRKVGPFQPNHWHSQQISKPKPSISCPCSHILIQPTFFPPSMKHESSTSEKQSVEGFFHFNSSCSPSRTEIKCYFNYSIVLLVFKQSYFTAETAAVQKHMQISLFLGKYRSAMGNSNNFRWLRELLESLPQDWGVQSSVSPFVNALLWQIMIQKQLHQVFNQASMNIRSEMKDLLLWQSKYYIS